MSISEKKFGEFGGKEVIAYTMTNKSGASMTVLNYGGIINKLLIPDKNGKLGDIICGFDTVEGYVEDRKSYTGSLVGRCGNRISHGGFMLNGKRIYVANNEQDVVHLHGGYVGFNRKIWDVKKVEGKGSDSLVLTLFSPDMEEGYPGDLFVTVTYTFDDDNAMTIHYEAVSDKDTYINLTNHGYYNLNGYDGGSVMGHILKLNSDYYDALDEHLCPVEKASVTGTKYDFRTPRAIEVGYDNNFYINGKVGEMRECGTVTCPKSGRTMTITTDAEGVQLYTAVCMDGETRFKGGVKQEKLCAFCVETQNAPDLPNRPYLEQRFTKAGEKYSTTTKISFGISK